MTTPEPARDEPELVSRFEGARSNFHGAAEAPSPDAGAAARHRNNFDFLRLCAALMVFWSHAHPLTGRPEEPLGWTGFATLGSVGVGIFFSMSGFLVTKSWFEDPHPLRFLARRALRLFPGLIVIVALTAFVVGPAVTALPLGEYFHHQMFHDYLRSALILPSRYRLPGTFMHNAMTEMMDGPLWTLPIETLMYLVVLLLGVVGILRHPAAVPAVLVMVAGAALFVWGHFGFTPVHFAGFDVRYLLDFGAFFFVGAAMYVGRGRIPRSLPVAAVALFASALFLHSLYGRTYLAFALGYATIVLAETPLPLVHGAARWGDFSYGTYIYAYPVQQLVVAWLGPPRPGLASAAAIGLVATLACAALSWHFVEAPMLRLKPRRPARGPRIT